VLMEGAARVWSHSARTNVINIVTLINEKFVVCLSHLGLPYWLSSSV
jgi:hypothetical protein